MCSTRVNVTALTMFSLLFPLGCGGSRLDPTYPVKGTVTLVHQPLSRGTIYFMTPGEYSARALQQCERNDGDRNR